MGFSEFSEVTAKVVPGYGVASGKSEDGRFPDGTLDLQIPIFNKLGLNLSNFYRGTLNLDLSPYSYKLVQPDYKFEKVKWSKFLPAENFSFYPCSVTTSCNSLSESFTGFVYWPHPSTKPEFHQNTNVIEVILPFIPDIKYGIEVKVKALNESISFFTSF